MTRIASILVRVRDTLADPKKERWDDDRLLRLVDEAQQTIVLAAKTLRSHTKIALFAGIETYKLPEDCFRLLRVTDVESNTILPLRSFDEMDRCEGSWEADIGDEAKAIVYDKQPRKHITVYPIPTLSEDWSFQEALAVAPESISFFGGSIIVNTCNGSVVPVLHGVVTGGDGLVLNSLYGTVVTVDGIDSYVDQGTNEPTAFGFVVAATDGKRELKVRYLKKPDPVTSVDSVLEIDEIYDKAIKFYVTGMALRDDKDVQNRQIGNEELSFFQIAIQESVRDGERDFVGANTQYEVPYIGGF